MTFLTSMFTALWGRVAGYVVALGALLTILFGAWAKGRSDAKAKAKLEDVTNANDIRKAGADARASAGAGKLHDNDGWRRD
jgi:hypothetical protein